MKRTTMETLSPATFLSFKDFLLKDKKNRLVLLMAGGLMIIQFSIFKYLYPFASYINGDSFVYLDAAEENARINTYPVGYSNFLRLFSVFSRSDTVLVIFQYLCLQASALFLLFTIFYFYQSGRVIRYILLGFMTINPLFWHLANLVSSDCLFAALSLTWFSLLLWIVHRPSKRVIFWQALVLFLAFSFRYNALIYPLITIIAFALVKMPLPQKIVGAGAGILFCALFVSYTSYQYKQLSGLWQFSPFSGWLMANNAMYAYRYVDSSDRKSVDKKFQALDNMIRQFYDSTHDTKRFPTEAMIASTAYMWTPWMSLTRYRDSLFAKDTSAKELKKWASMGPFYREYGLHIIKKYPGYYFRHFIWPNSQKYYAPPVEFLEQYNSGTNWVTTQAQKWFGYKEQRVRTRIGDSKVWVLDYYPILSGIINVLMFFGLLYFLLLKGWQYNRAFNKLLLMGGAVWLLNAFFTIGASSAALRFQSFPVLLTTTFTLLLVDWLFQLMKSMQVSAQASLIHSPSPEEDLSEVAG